MLLVFEVVVVVVVVASGSRLEVGLAKFLLPSLSPSPACCRTRRAAARLRPNLLPASRPKKTSLDSRSPPPPTTDQPSIALANPCLTPPLCSSTSTLPADNCILHHFRVQASSDFVFSPRLVVPAPAFFLGGGACVRAWALSVSTSRSRPRVLTFARGSRG